MDEVDRTIETLHPASWKGYTIGHPFGPSRFAWSLAWTTKAGGGGVPRRGTSYRS